jgi:O-acetylhomoserine (thiol)-lyase
VVIARSEDMFLPKGASMTVKRPNGRREIVNWDETLFWNVYYIKGAFLDADKAYEVINGMRTLELRMLSKCITTSVLARALAHHPRINVNCGAVPGHANAKLREANMFLGLPAPLFTIDFEPKSGEQPLPRAAFKAFFDMLEPAFGLQVSLGQTNTVVLCPALTSHSEMSDEALKEAGISRTTIRIAVGNEDPRTLLAHFMRAAELAFETLAPDFAQGFMPLASIDSLYEETYSDVHRRYVQSKPKMTELMN